MERRTFQPGDRLFREGEAGQEAYIIESGSVEISKRVGGDETRILGVSGKGEMIGEMALIDNAPRMASARAREQTVTIVVPRSSFSVRLEKSDPVVRRVLNLMIQRLRHQTDEASRRHTVVR